MWKLADDLFSQTRKASQCFCFVPLQIDFSRKVANISESYCLEALQDSQKACGYIYVTESNNKEDDACSFCGSFVDVTGKGQFPLYI